MKHIKVQVIGCEDRLRVDLVHTYCNGGWSGGYFPTTGGVPSHIDMVEDMEVNVEMWYPSNGEEYKKLRPLGYPDTDLFILCFSLVLPSSLEEVQKEWLPEVKEHCPDTPYILVGLLSDSRDSFEKHAEEYREKGWEPVPTAKGEEMKEAIGAQAYVECGARINYNVKKVFHTAIKIVLHSPPRSRPESGKKKDCQIA
jgi:Ras-related C3 botulinum toxin substrate 1